MIATNARIQVNFVEQFLQGAMQPSALHPFRAASSPQVLPRRSPGCAPRSAVRMEPSVQRTARESPISCLPHLRVNKISQMFSKRSGIVCRVNLLPTSVSSLVSAVLAKFRGNGCMTCKVIEEGDPGIERVACATSFPSIAFFNFLRVLGYIFVLKG